MSFCQGPRNIDEKLEAMLKAKQKADEVLKGKKIMTFSKETYNKLISFLPIFEVEFFYRKESLASKIKLCSEYGIIYISEEEDKKN
ncbi:MAG: hypothetical protein HY738_08405 [Bacteroidia bacterium]|nr:hypothetical protein [Bacteroidia bacterium]